MNIFLTKLEIIELTGAKQAEKQRRWLMEHGYEFDVRIDGSNVVLRSHLEKKLGGNRVFTKFRKIEPNIQTLLEA